MYGLYTMILLYIMYRKMSICNIDKDTFVYMWYGKIFYIKYMCSEC